MLEAWEDDEKEELERTRGGNQDYGDGSRTAVRQGTGGYGEYHSYGDGGARQAGLGEPSGGLGFGDDFRQSGERSGRFASTANSNNAEYSSPQFELEIVEGSTLRGSGEVTCACAANDCVLLGTRSGCIVKYDYSSDFGGDQNRTVIQLSKSGNHAVTQVHLDRSSVHCLAVLEDTSSGSREYAYMNTVTQQPRLLTKLRGLDVQCVGWTDIHSENAFLRGSGTATGPVLLGTKAGEFHEVQVDESEKKERAPRLLYALREREAVYGVDFATFGEGSTSVLVVAISATRCYLFSSGASGCSIVKTGQLTHDKPM